jgi:putative hemolysin
MTSRDRRFRLQSYLASTAADVRAAQRLRWRVFSQELGAQLPAVGVDEDRFDAYCDHLLVRDVVDGEVVGTYRILSAAQAARAGGFYSETEFELGALRELPGLVELGRACVHQRYRDGAVLSFLWSSLARHIHGAGYEHVIGCASVPVADGGHGAASLYTRLAREHLGPPAWRVRPHHPLPIGELDCDTDAVLPPLVRGYLRMGAWMCGPPAWDREFGTADILLLLPMSRMRQRFRQHFLRAA